MDRERNLLFGVFGVQLKQFTAQQLIEIAAAWAADPSRDIAVRMTDAALLSASACQVLLGLVEEAVRAHNGSARETLDRFGGEQQVSEVFRDSILEGHGKADATVRADWNWPSEGLPTIISAVDEAPGRYSQISEHGRGGFGRVLLVHDQHLDRDIALKELLNDVITASDDANKNDSGFSRHVMEIITRFLQEARITSQLEHPSIVPVYELGRRKDGSLYYTMRFVRGVTMSQALSDAKTLTNRIELLPHFVDLCNAIGYAHARGIIHRDIKPNNVMVGHFGETVLLDWGLAKAVAHKDIHAADLADTIRAFRLGDDVESAKTSYGRAMGTPAYMPPEQALGHLDQVDERSDVYSLGAVLYEILTGHLPYHGKRAVDVLQKVVSEPPTPITTHEPQAPPELVAICEHAMARDPLARHPGAMALAEEIRRYQLGAMVESYRYTARQRIARFVRKHKTSLATAAGFAMVLIAGGAVANIRIIQERNHAVAAQSDAEKQLYVASVLLARNWITQTRFDLADVALSRSPVALRNWEWGHLYRLCHEDETTITGHRRGIAKMSLSPNGATLISGSEDGALRLVDVKTGRAVHELIGHTLSIYTLNFSPDGARVVSGADDGKVLLWDTQTGNQVAALLDDKLPVYEAAFSSDGTRIASCGGDHAVHVSDAATGKEIVSIVVGGDNVRAVAFTKDGRQILGGLNDGGFGVWDAATGAEVTRISPTGQPGAMSVAVSPTSGKIVVTSGYDSINVLNPATFEVVRSVKTTSRIWTRLRFASDGIRVVFGDRSGLAFVVNIETGEVLTLRGHTDLVCAAEFDQKGNQVVTASGDKTARVWDAATGGLIATLNGHSGDVTGAAFLGDGKTVVTCSLDTTVKIWKIGETEKSAVRIRHSSQARVDAVVFSPDGQRLVSYAMDRSLTLWNVGSLQEYSNNHYKRDNIFHTAWNNDSSRVVAGFADGLVMVLDAATGEPVAQMSANNKVIHWAEFSPDGATVVSASGDGTARIWDIAQGSPVRELKRAGSPMIVARFDPQGTRIVTGDESGEAVLWTVNEGEPQPIARREGQRVLSAAFDHLGKRVAVGFQDGSICLLTLAGMGQTWLTGQVNGITQVVFTSGDDRVVTASEDGTARVWSTADGHALMELKGHTGPVWQVGYNPDETRMVTASEDGTAKIWDAATGQELCVLSGDMGKVKGAAFSRDGRIVATASADGTVRFWMSDKD